MNITLSGAQVFRLHEFIAPDNTTEQWKQEVTIEYVKDKEGVEDGYYAYITEYPEEGSVYLGT